MNKRKRQNPAPLQSRKERSPKTQYTKQRLDKTFVLGFTKTVWEWYRAHAPDLPWRKTKDPYHILVSEVMLQQTQILRVLIKYPQFLKTFPTIQTLAQAPLRSILSVWHGMGYNRRGLYIQKAAQQILELHNGKIPKDTHLLDALPGIGPYSARAIACFAYGTCGPFVETNIRRVIIHEFFPRKKKISDSDILAMLREVEPQNKKREWYWALMDYGREALKHVPNANRKSKHYAKQSKFEGSPRYIRAKIISYLLENKKATAEQLHTSLKKDKHLARLPAKDMITALQALEKEKLIMKSGLFFLISPNSPYSIVINVRTPHVTHAATIPAQRKSESKINALKL